MKTTLIIKLTMTGAALALAACGSSGKGDGNGTAAATGGGGSASGVALQPGEWEMKMEVVNVVAEGLPAGMAEGMKKTASTTNRTCMTPEEAKAPKGDLFAGNKASGCRSEGFKWDGGRIEGKTICPGQGGTGETTMTMAGTYGAQEMDMTMKSQTDLMGKPMTMEMRVSGKRIGECSAATKSAG